MPDTIVSSRGSADDTAHRLDGIDDEIDDYLLQLDPICRDERQVVRKPVLQADAMALHLGLGQGDDLADGLIDVQEIAARRQSSLQARECGR